MKNYNIYLSIDNGDEGFNIPILPQSIEINQGGDNKTTEVINLGQVNIIKRPKLMEISFKSFFPNEKAYYVSSDKLFSPKFYIDKINGWREDKKKIRLIFTGGAIEINEQFTIEDFKISENGGEIGDIYYELSFKRFVEYAARKVTIVNEPNKVTATPQSTTQRPTDKPKVKTHTVVKGDTLWHIAKKYLGNGNRYKEIAKLNNIKNPDLIYPGQVFKIP